MRLAIRSDHVTFCLVLDRCSVYLVSATVLHRKISCKLGIPALRLSEHEGLTICETAVEWLHQLVATAPPQWRPDPDPAVTRIRW